MQPSSLACQLELNRKQLVSARTGMCSKLDSVDFDACVECRDLRVQEDGTIFESLAYTSAL